MLFRRRSTEGRATPQMRQTAAAQFVAELQGVVPRELVTRELQNAFARFRALHEVEEMSELPPTYLAWERAMAETSGGVDNLRARMLETLTQRFPSLMADRGFALIFDRRRPQERILCQMLLVKAVKNATALIDSSGGVSLRELAAWLENIPNVSLPVPLDLRPTLPHHNSEWSALMFRLARELYLFWEPKFGGACAQSFFERAYDELAHRYMLMGNFPVVVNLLPPALIDSEKLAKLSRSQVQNILLEKIVDLNLINTQLARKNLALDTVRNELVDAQTSLEERVAERTRELQQLNEELRTAKERAEVADRAKGDFLANMSHELRTPLNAIMGFSQVIRDGLFGEIDPRYRDYAKDIYNSGRHLLAIINDILDLTKLESGKFKLREEQMDVADILGGCLEMVRPRANETHIELFVDAAPGLPQLFADPLRIKQIMINLLSNAVKFTPSAGRVTASARRDPSGEMVLAVSDTGIGIRAEDIALALEPFGQIDSKLNRSYEGTGLGLPLVKRLTELHGGKLEIVSTPGVGTVVSIRLPAERIMAPPTRAAG
jgi:signal transduction histidine kinase